tara:strand:+ start:4983 stop:5468 length:486 start_codon:yes stop_codon:yes gene_type:complete
MVTGGPTITAEGCYTVASPMAVIGKVWNDSALKNRALEQLKHRFVLIENGNLNLRYHSDKGSYSYKNWARGAARILLGFARTLAELKGEIQNQEIIIKFKEGVDNAISMQKANKINGLGGPNPLILLAFRLSSGNWTRTSDLRVMSSRRATYCSISDGILS